MYFVSKSKLLENSYTIIIYGCDYEKNGRGLGPESKARIDRAIRYLEKQSINPIAIVLAAGAPPKKAYEPLKKYMRIRLDHCFLKKACESSTFTIPNIIVAERQYWGTFEETLFANDIADCYACTHIVAVSSWYHLYRIALITNMLSGDKTVDLVPSWKISSWLSPFLELLKIPKVFLDYKKYKKQKASAKKLPSPS